MTPASAKWGVLYLAGWAFCCAEEPPGVLERFLAKTETELRHLPDYVCTQRIDRFSRGTGEGPWKQDDALTYTVGIAGGEEVYAHPDGRDVLNSSLASHARSGVVSSGQFGLMARHVFARKAASIGYRGESERAGRKAHEFEFDVPKQQSRYRLRMGNSIAEVAFQGSFHVDAGTLDLLELEVQAYDIPETLGLASADTKITYSRVEVRGASPLLPSTATLILTTTGGVERLNRARFGDCQRFETESAMVDEAPGRDSPAEAATPPRRLAPGTILEVALGADLTPEELNPGDPITARLLKPVEGTDGYLLPAGTVIHGIVARLHRDEVPFPTYEIGLEFTGVESEGETVPLNATMVDVGAQKGVIRQAKRLDPKFSKKQRPRLDVLVREVQKGRGILLWDAKRPTVPKGLKMKWLVAEDTPERPAGRK